MFAKVGLRFKIALFWILCFTSLWLLFGYTFPYKEMGDKLNKIEHNIVNKDWAQADKNTKELIKLYSKRKYLIHINNSTEALISFEHSIGQLQTAITHKKDEAIEYIGGLRQSLNFVVKPFAGP